MRSLLIIFLLLLSNICSAQIVVDSNKATLVQKQEVPQVNVKLPSTLKIENVSKLQVSLLDKNMPWLVALLIGILSAFVNLRIGNRLRLSNENNLRRQIESNEKNLQSQIETSKEIKLLEFKATISAKNRQEWINELRHTISEFLSISMQLTPDEHEQIGQLSHPDKIKFFDKFFYTKAKIELLLNSEKMAQQEVLDNVEAVVDVLTKKNEEFNGEDMQTARANLILSSRKLFDLHWKKIKNLK